MRGGGGVSLTKQELAAVVAEPHQVEILLATCSFSRLAERPNSAQSNNNNGESPQIELGQEPFAIPCEREDMRMVPVNYIIHKDGGRLAVRCDVTGRESL